MHAVPDRAVGALGERPPVALPVDLGAGGEQQALAVPGGEREHGVGSQRVGANRVERLLDHEPHPDDRGEVEAGVDRAHALLDQLLLEHGADNELHLVVLEQVLDVLTTAGAEIVEDHDLVAAGHQCIRDVRTDEPSSTGDQESQRTLHSLYGPMRRTIRGQQIERETQTASY